MIKRNFGLLGLSLVVALASTGCAGNNSNAGLAVNQAAQASGLVVGSAAHAIAASGQVALGAAAIPLAATGAVASGIGAASSTAARSSMKAAVAQPGAPLPVTDQTISAISPDQALKK